MNYCTNCGSELNGAKFCAKCGARVGEVSQVLNESLVRRQSLEKMQELIAYFGTNIEKETEFLSARLDVEKLKNKKNKGCLKLGIVLELPSILLLLLGAVDAAFFFAIPGIIVFGIYAMLRNKNAEKIEKAEKKQQEIWAEIQEYYNAYPDCPMGIEYTSMTNLLQIEDIIRSGRKNTIGEAIQAILDDEHTMRMEDEAKRTRESAEEAAREAREAKKHAQQAEKKASSAEFWSLMR